MELKSAMDLGIELGKSRFQKSGNSTEDCESFFPECKSVPESYRFPGIKEPTSTDPETLNKHREMSSKMIEKFLRIAEEKYDFERLRLNTI